MEATPPAAKPAVVLSGLRKEFPDTPPVVAVDDLDLEIHDGEFFSMLGPSGSGKTTALRMIAGFETPTSGRVELGGQDVTKIQPYDRDVNTVFQDYAPIPAQPGVRRQRRRRDPGSGLDPAGLARSATRRHGSSGEPSPNNPVTVEQRSTRGITGYRAPCQAANLEHMPAVDTVLSPGGLCQAWKTIKPALTRQKHPASPCTV